MREVMRAARPGPATGQSRSVTRTRRGDDGPVALVRVILVDWTVEEGWCDAMRNDVVVGVLAVA